MSLGASALALAALSLTVSLPTLALSLSLLTLGASLAVVLPLLSSGLALSTLGLTLTALLALGTVLASPLAVLSLWLALSALLGLVLLLWVLALRRRPAGRCGRGFPGSVFLPSILVVRRCHLFIIFLSFGFGLLFWSLGFCFGWLRLGLRFGLCRRFFCRSIFFWSNSCRSGFCRGRNCRSFLWRLFYRRGLGDCFRLRHFRLFRCRGLLGLWGLRNRVRRGWRSLRGWDSFFLLRRSSALSLFPL